MSHWLKSYTERAFDNIQDTDWIDEEYATKLTEKLNAYFGCHRTVEEIKELLQFASHLPQSLCWVITQNNKQFIKERE